MILKFYFNQLSKEGKIKFLLKKGVELGSRTKNDRKIFIYMISNLFVEVVYKNDEPYSTAESVIILNGLNNLHQYLETEFRARF